MFYLNQRDQAVDLDELERIFLGGVGLCVRGRVWERRVHFYAPGLSTLLGTAVHAARAVLPLAVTGGRSGHDRKMGVGMETVGELGEGERVG